MVPIMNGWDFLLAQRADPELSKISAMIVSAVAEPDKFPDVRGFIRKPYEPDNFLNLVMKRCECGGRIENHPCPHLERTGNFAADIEIASRIRACFQFFSHNMTHAMATTPA